MADTYIKISELEETTLADDASYIPIDNGNHTYKISVENYNSGANATAQSYAEAAAASADDAETAKTAAEAAETETGLIRTATQQYATAAAGSAANAAASAIEASTYAEGAAASEANAEAAAQDAADYATLSSDKATLAESWAVGDTHTRTGEDTNNASYYAGQAQGAYENALEQADAAGDSADAAASSASDAADSATAAAGSASDASGYATAASGSATAAATSATQSANSAGAAATSATNAAASATAASGSASTATTQATNAAQSATTAGGYATQAASSASDASGYATNAANSATAAAGSATTASNQATAAAGSATAAAASASDAADSAATFTTDDTLSIAGKAADAKAAGDMIAAVQAEIPELDNWLTTAGAAAEAKHTGDRLTAVEEDTADLKSAFSEFPSGSYPDMTVGGVMSVEDGAEDQVPYTFRASGGGVAVGNREIDTLVGGTVAWNQISKINAIRWTAGYGGITITKVDDTAITLTGTATINAQARAYATGYVFPPSHVYVGIGFQTVKWYIGNSSKATGDGVVKPSTNTEGNVLFDIPTGTDFGTGLTIKPMIFDLTQMFGSTIADYVYALETATAGAGVAWFRRLFGADYYPFDAGSLKSVEGVSAHVTRGFNQWDEEWELGGIDSNTGEDTARTDRIRNIGYIPVIPGARYYIKKPANSMSFRWYDANKTYVGSGSTSGDTFAERSVPSNASYLRFVIADVTTYTPGTLCLNLYNPDKNGTYEPYVSHTYPLDSSLTLRGIPKLDSANRLYYDGDRYASDGTVTRRYGVVVFDGSSDENWHYYTISSSDGANNLFRTSVADRKAGNVAGNAPDCLVVVNGYLPAANNTSGRTNLTISGTSTNCDFVNAAYSSVDAWRTYLASNPITLVYELATPTTESANPYTNPQIVDNLGTEEYVTTGIVPVGHSTIYPTDIVAKVDGLPSDFSTLIAVTETGFKASRAYSVNQFLIVSNQLYKVTASIASGATITPGTNVTACTVADILTQLLNA